MRAPDPRVLSIVLLASLALLPGASYAARVPADDADSPSGVLRTEVPSTEIVRSPSGARAFHRAAAVGETVYVFSDSMNTRSSPNNEGGWTHYDASEKPTAWHRDSVLTCQGAAWWCGLVDSLWVFDSNRAGYDNDWVQNLESTVDLSGISLGTTVTLGFRHRFDAEPDYDFGFVEVLDINEGWVPLLTLTGKVPNNGCDSVTLVIPDSIRADYNPVAFRFVFTSDVGYSSADGLYDGDGWIVDNITVKAGSDVRFFDDGSGGNRPWQVSTFPGVGDFFWLNGNVFTEDICLANTSKVWTDWDPVVFSLIPRLDNLLNTPPVATSQASDVFVEFDVYRNLPLLACFYYHLNFRTKSVGDANWSLWQDPTFFVYYGGNKDWIRQRIPLQGAGGVDSVQVQLGLRDYSAIFCDGETSSGGVYGLFDNVAIGIVASAAPSFAVRDIDFFNDTFQTTPFMAAMDDNFNSPVGDSVVVNVNASRGFREGYLHYRLNAGSFSSVPLVNVAPALPTRFYADVPPGSYPANTTIEYYFSATDSMNATAYYPANAPTTQRYLSASILPVKTATNPSLGCFDSTATILFVNHFSGRETSPRIADVLKALGHKFDTWDVNGPSSGIGNCLGGSDPADQQHHWPVTDVNSLLQYKTIIWHSGDLSSFTITKEDQAVIQSWIQQPGKDRNFWITGDDVANELATTGVDYNSFLQFTTGARYVRDMWENPPQDTLRPRLTGVAGGPAAGRVMTLNGDCPIPNDFDMVASSNTAISNGKAGLLYRYPNNQGAATRYATRYVSFGSDSARAVFMGFSFNLIQEGGERIQLGRLVTETYFKEVPCYSPTAVEEDPVAGAPPIRTQLFQNAPNPFNPETTIRFSVGSRGPVEIEIYSVSGRLVRKLVEDVYEPGVYSVRWDGTDDGGSALASGAYFYRLRADGKTDSRKLILLK